ncbi:DUF2637 domain-containing protein [Streptomyces sp. NPDC005423]|uniref:DUF2637 domain-containing protein n=1 Tax=Streptomyces sp. NPDC005423 TaxID=3155343 RepID=UPI0033A06186
MNYDYADPYSARGEWSANPYLYPADAGWSGSPVDAVHTEAPLTPPDLGWDPVEELTYILQETVPAEPAAVVPPPRQEPPPSVEFIDPAESLVQTTAQVPPLRSSAVGHRKSRARELRVKWLRTGSFMIVAFVAVLVAMVSVFGGMVAYEPLKNITSSTKDGLISWWPILVYGPWIVASLSVLRSALHRRRALHSWLIVLLFSCIAIMLCVVEADRTVTGIAGAALPALASLACFHQLVRQITLTLPPQQETPRHRR